MRFGKLEIDPAVNPAVLDTATWDVERVPTVLGFVGKEYWQTVHRAVAAAGAAPGHAECRVYPGSWTARGGNAFSLVRLSDGQHVFVEIGTGDGALANEYATRV